MGFKLPKLPGLGGGGLPSLPPMPGMNKLPLMQKLGNLAASLPLPAPVPLPAPTAPKTLISEVSAPERSPVQELTASDGIASPQVYAIGETIQPTPENGITAPMKNELVTLSPIELGSIAGLPAPASSGYGESMTKPAEQKPAAKDNGGAMAALGLALLLLGKG